MAGRRGISEIPNMNLTYLAAQFIPLIAILKSTLTTRPSLESYFNLRVDYNLVSQSTHHYS